MIHNGNEWAALFPLTAEAVGPCASIMCDRHYRGEERTTELPLTQGMIGQFEFEAAFRNVTIGKLIGQFIVTVADKDLLQTVLEHKKLR